MCGPVRPSCARPPWGGRGRSRWVQGPEPLYASQRRLSPKIEKDWGLLHFTVLFLFVGGLFASGVGKKSLSAQDLCFQVSPEI